MPVIPPSGPTNGTINTDNGTVSMSLAATYPEVQVGISGTFVGTLTFQVYDGNTWYNVGAIPLGGGQSVQSVTGTGNYRFGAAGYQQARVIMHPYTSGTATIYMDSTAADPSDLAYVRNSFTMTGVPTSVTSSNSVLKILTTGSAAWTSDTASANAGVDRYLYVTNCEPLGGLYLYLGMVATGGARSGSVSSTSFMQAVPPTATAQIFVPSGYELTAVKGSSSSNVITAWEQILR